MAKASFAEPRPVGVLWILAYPLYAVFAAMVFLCAQELAQPLVTQAPRPVAPDDPDWEAKFPARVEALQKALGETALPLSLSREREQGSGTLRWTHRFYDLTVAEADRAEVEGKLTALQAVDGGVTLTAENVFGGNQVLMGIDGLLTHTLRLYWAEQTLQPRVSLLVAALGDDLRLARAVIDVDAPLALGIGQVMPCYCRLLGSVGLAEDDKEIAPAVAAARTAPESMPRVRFRPTPSFSKMLGGLYDLVVVMYHDRPHPGQPRRF